MHFLPFSDKVKRVVCNSEVCQQRAKLILASINQSADPCEDFYEYVCKRWTDAHPIPEGSDSLGNLEIVTDEVEKDLKATHTSKDKGLKIIKKLLAKSGLGLWPLIGNATRHPFKNSVEVLNMTGGLSLILSFVVVKDLSEGKSKRVQFPLLELLNKEFNKGNVTLNYNDKILVNAVDYINNTLKFITETDP
ncbi:hypothetical protein V5799_015199 [Amblyomma americanum]|uniref:Peptidase M13 N-terminal domain-containing protein n=1 Tax=Amblyomma americanum TaxID=6943 RepID=A0AAQ4E0U5_AMBAM